ncbi:MAG: FAD-dependent oxidoreductase [Clostridium argentinense]|uniref:FAD-dependent oxidoreductase n=1 Tax=Clostridium faecium TaxID=2762223 RepID=A0ABR8YV44_9CLOT|nr:MULTISPECIES: NAD(P)/FAD-dependent oxidoreductase [Clostridium]MBD8048064.1 FAD-dependent oxidoreductase [Clostridium faecium]MBS5822493.1 FAD-dependent oxidoreductase [Clostridium argentinense]MDU1350101.1 NAD(P)/FAD-dependent oxidoreductase [Clostridium argentinense]
MSVEMLKLQPNPTNEQRYELIRYALNEAGRPEDFYNVINLLSPPPDIINYAPPMSLKGVKIGIIGGGVAGLSSAFELRKLGADITIYEALKDRIGGRIYTHYFDKDKNLYGEYGAMRVPVSHETTWHYMNLFRLKTNPFIQSNPNAFLLVRNRRIRNRSENIEKYIYPLFPLEHWEKNTSWDELYNYGMNSSMNNLTPKERMDILRILPKYNSSYEKLDNLSIRQVLESKRLSQGAIELISGVDSLTSPLFNVSYNEVIQENYPVNFSYLYQIDGGMVNLPLAFHRSLTSEEPKEYEDIPNCMLGTCNWKSGCVVTGIYKIDTEGERVFIEYNNRNNNKRHMESFDYVICAIPFTTLREVDIAPAFSTRKMQAIKEYNYVDSLKAFFYCRRRFWEENRDYGRILNGVSYTDEAIQSVVYPSDHTIKKGYCPEEPGILLASYSLTLDSIRVGAMKEDEKFNLIKRQVEKVHGLPSGYLDNLIKEYKTVHWNMEPYARGAFTAGYPGQKTLFAYNILQPEYNERVFFAGEHASATHAWIQGALYSGKFTANNLAKHAMKHKKK